MFEMFPNFWTPVLPVVEIGSTPVAVELAGESLVLFRNSAGAIAALLDRCPHRGIPLSHGQVTAEGCLECPYHGWQFASNGSCTRVPLNSLKPTQLSKLSVISFPTRVIAGVIWVFTGIGNAPEPQLPPSLLDAAARYVIQHEVWKAHWTRAVENALDYLHIPFVHRNSFGGELNAVAHTNAIAQINITPIANGITVINRINTLPSGIELDWHQPNCVVVKFDSAENAIPLRSHIFAIPINPQKTRFMQVILPNSGIDQTNFDFETFMAPVVEDRVMIELQVGEVPKVTEESHMPTDEPSLRFRRWYYGAVKNRTTEVIQEAITP